jgi:hypothetical protein
LLRQTNVNIIHLLNQASRTNINYSAISLQMADTARPSFLNLPAEIREEIYKCIFEPASNRTGLENEYWQYHFASALNILLANKQIYVEARKVFRDLNVFVRIDTPGEMARQHVADEGHVPIIVSGPRATKFSLHSLRVLISSPSIDSLSSNHQVFIIHLDDLHKFALIWKYADLSYEGLNQHLQIALTLRHPTSTLDSDARDIHDAGPSKQLPVALQKRLIMPFGQVKHLYKTEFTGSHEPAHGLEDALKAAQAKPHASPESCLAEATKYKDAGNALLKAGNPRAALQEYVQAWRALHIVIHGRLRHVHADRYFVGTLSEAPYAGLDGQVERLRLRVQLVANTCLAYYQLQDHRECVFWGMRTIVTLRNARDGALADADAWLNVNPRDEAMLGFPAADQMGKIYYRTAMSMAALGEDSTVVRRFLLVAGVYLPRDKTIQKAIEESTSGVPSTI